MCENPPDQQLIVITRLDSVFFEEECDFVQGILFQQEFSGDFATVGPLTDCGFVESSSEQQRDSPHQNRFSRARLSGDRIESGSEFQIRFIHQRQILDMEPFQHGEDSSIFSRRLARARAALSKKRSEGT